MQCPGNCLRSACVSEYRKKTTFQLLYNGSCVDGGCQILLLPRNMFSCKPFAKPVMQDICYLAFFIDSRVVVETRESDGSILV